MASIYIIYSPNGFAKVGYANLPFERFSGLNNSNPLELSFEYLCECPDAKQVEAALHEDLKEFHHRCEWFSIDAATVVERVRSVIARNHALATVAYPHKPLGQPRRVLPKLQEIARA